MKSCNEIKEMISLYIDNELDAELHKEFENHIQSCEDCRTELEELEQIISLCGSISEEELPEDFKQQLHEKLLAVSDSSCIVTKESNKSKLHKYVRIGTSIAAVLLIAVMLKVLYPLSGVSQKLTGSSQAAEGANSASGTQSSYDKADNGSASYSMDVQDQYGTVEEKNAVIAGDIAGTESEKSRKSEKGTLKKAEEPVASEAPKQKSAEEARMLAPDKLEKEAEVKEAQMFSVLIVSENTIKDTDITVKVEDPGIEIDKLKSKALEYGAEFRQEKSIDGAGGGISDEAGGTKLVFRMPYAQYDSFVEALINAYGQGFVVVGTINTINMDEQIKGYETRLNELNNKISVLEEAGTETEAEELTKLNNERESVQKEYDSLMLGVQYISVCIQISHK